MFRRLIESATIGSASAVAEFAVLFEEELDDVAGADYSRSNPC